jgi:pilus assembly protein CpaF
MASIRAEELQQGAAPPPLRPAFGSSSRPEGASSASAVGNDGHLTLKLYLHRHLQSAIAAEGGERPDESRMRLELRRLADEWSHQNPDALGIHELEATAEHVLDDVLGYGPIAGLMRDSEISEILINGPRQLYFEKRGQIHPSDVTFRV